MARKALEEEQTEGSLARIVRGRLSLLKRQVSLRVLYARSLLRSKLSHKPVVYVIGDSHTGIFLKRKPFVVFWLGPATAHNLGMRRSTTNSNKKLRAVLDSLVTPRDKVLMVFGEVDCRIHIYNQYVTNRERLSIEDVIGVTVEKYGEVLREIEGRGLDLYVASVPPGGKEGNVFGVPNYPPPDMRRVINRIFNEELAAFCRLYGLKFIDVYSTVVDADGFIKPEYSYADGTHLNTAAVRFFEEGLGLEAG